MAPVPVAVVEFSEVVAVSIVEPVDVVGGKTIGAVPDELDTVWVAVGTDSVGEVAEGAVPDGAVPDEAVPDGAVPEGIVSEAVVAEVGSYEMVSEGEAPREVVRPVVSGMEPVNVVGPATGVVIGPVAVAPSLTVALVVLSPVGRGTGTTSVVEGPVWLGPLRVGESAGLLGDVAGNVWL